ncbi:MAG: TetR/AcrR family transcriptional regulator [Eubacterium sp.]|nr:TetR/AcrR family transcriptional regulator [Eubacterium sp.]
MTQVEKQMATTKDRIEEEALKEFGQKGYQGASLRQIVKRAGVTTGAFYKYYATKEDLFSGVIGIHADFVYQLYDKTMEDFSQQPLETQTETMMGTSEDSTGIMLDYVYDHYQAFKILINGAEGSPYSDFIHQLVVRETRSTIDYMNLLKSQGQGMQEVDEELIHMISSGVFTSFFEMVTHDMSREEAEKRFDILRNFYAAGYEYLFQVKFG